MLEKRLRDKLLFTFRVQAKGKDLRSVQAETYEQAARKAALRLYGAPHATRVWGLTGFSGYFQGQRSVYREGRRQRINVGAAFHLQMMWSMALTDIEANGYTDITTINIERENNGNE